MIEREIFDQAVTLTAIGVGTAFVVLLFLSLILWVSGWAFSRFSSRNGDVEAEVLELSPESRSKALAAVVAVATALQKERSHGRIGVV